MRTIVSITPLSVQRDSRTFKIAASLARAGHRSIVVEGEASAAPGNPPFELVSVGPPAGAGDAAPAATGRLQAWVRRAPWAYDAARAARFAARFNLPLLGRLPAADLYYLHAPYQFPAVRLIAARAGTPVVYDAHDFYSLVYDPPSPVVRWIEGRCVRDAAEVITVSDGVADLIAAEFGRRPIVMRNSQDARLERSPARGLRERLGLPVGAFCLVTTGNVKDSWTMPELARALAALPAHVHLAVVGGTGERAAGAVRDAGVADRIHFVPPVAPDEVVPFIRSADAFVIAYLPADANYEHSLPNKFFHAVAAELPLLYPPLPEIARLAERHRIGLPIDPRSAESIRAAVATLLEQPAERARLARDLAAARVELGWEREEAILFEVVDRVIAGGRDGQAANSRSNRART